MICKDTDRLLQPPLCHIYLNIHSNHQSMRIISLFLGSVGQHSFAASGKRSTQYKSKYCGFVRSASTDASGSSQQPSHNLVKTLAQWQV